MQNSQKLKKDLKFGFKCDIIKPSKDTKQKIKEKRKKL
jgi:hypothetical protein